MNTFLIFFAGITAFILWVRFSWKPAFPKDFYTEIPMYIGHRGSLHDAPENTLSSYVAAIDAGFKGLEIDVIGTRDGKLVCSHNIDLERETDGSGFIPNSDWEDLSSVRAGVRSHPESPDRLYLLEDVSNVLPKDLRINIEIKTHTLFDHKTARAVVGLIRDGKIKQEVIVSSFNPVIIGIVKCLQKDIPTGYILDKENVHLKWCMYWAHPDCLHPTAEFVDDALLSFAKKRGLALNVWTVNSKPAVEWLAEKGVSGIITDYPRFIS